MPDEPTRDCAGCDGTAYAADIRVRIAEAGERMAREDATEAHRQRRKADAEKLDVEQREFLLLETLGMILHDDLPRAPNYVGPSVKEMILERHPEMKGKAQ